MVPLDVDGFVDEGIVVLVGLKCLLKWTLTCAVSQTSGPVRCEIAPRLLEALSLLAQERELRGL